MNRLRRTSARFLRRPAPDRRLLLEALICLAVLRVGLAVLPFERMVSRFGRLRNPGPGGPPSGLGPRVGWAVSAAARHSPWTSGCVAQALTAHRMLARRGVPSTLYVGVARPEGEDVVAHAWVQCGQDVVVGGRSSRQRFTVVGTFTGSG